MLKNAELTLKSMGKLNLKDVKIEVPKEFNGNPTDVEFIEWLEYELRMKCHISLSNPLCAINMKDCKISIGEARIDDKLIVF